MTCIYYVMVHESFGAYALRPYLDTHVISAGLSIFDHMYSNRKED